MARIIAIGGFMGVGKTTVGLSVADMLQVPFCDLDERVEALSGQSIASVFEESGESAFRDMEATALRQALDGNPKVLALGGGTLHHRGNCEYIQSKAVLFCLTLPFEILKKRLGETDVERPLWGVSAKHLYEARQPLYASAGVCIDTTGLSARRVAETIVETVLCS